MSSFRAYLQTRIARRVFGLFFLCALVPTATLAVSGYWLTARQLRDQANTQLAQSGKIAGTLLFARLRAADNALLDAMRDLADDRPMERLDDRLQSLSVVDREGRDSLMAGTPASPRPPLSARVREQLARGRPAVVVTGGASDPRIYLVREFSPSGERLWAELAQTALWGTDESEALAPVGVDVCVLTPTIPAPLYCSPGAGQVDPAASDVVTSSSDLFLGHEFAAYPWTVVLHGRITPAWETNDFRRTIVLICLATLALVVFASNVLLRQRLDPVATLQDGTRRLASGDFGATVKVDTGDEFEDLARSFNEMSAGLRRQFELLDALRRIDQTALRETSTEMVAQAAVAGIAALLPPSSRVGMLLARRAGERAALTWWSPGTGTVLEQVDASIASPQLDEWRAGYPAFRPGAQDLQLSGPEGLELRLGRCTLLPLLARGGCVGAVTIEDADPPADLGRIRQLADQAGMALSHHLSIERLQELSWGTLEALARTIDANSPWTAGHSERVTSVAMAIGRELGLGEEEIDRLHRGGLLHDVGKIGVPAAILDKPAALTLEETAIVQAHPVVGARILEPMAVFADVIDIVRHHHERFDGRGYPDRLVGEDIPLLARVTAVADVYDALVSRRPYREGWEPARAIGFIADGAGSLFDPFVVQAFLRMNGDGAEIREIRGRHRAASAGLVATGVGEVSDE
jgi:putative nucleotidyltransferase with HDIG domain